MAEVARIRKDLAASALAKYGLSDWGEGTMTKEASKYHGYYKFVSAENRSPHRLRVEDFVDFDKLFDLVVACKELYDRSGNPFDYPCKPFEGQQLKVKFAGCRKQEDMPWCPDGPVVSKRVAELLNQIQPGGFVTVPVVGTCLDSGTLAHEYVLIVAKKVVECHDLQKTRFQARSTRYIQYFVIDPSRVPSGMHIFRPMFFENRTLVSHAVREAMESAGMTGCSWFSSDSLDLGSLGYE